MNCHRQAIQTSDISKRFQNLFQTIANFKRINFIRIQKPSLTCNMSNTTGYNHKDIVLDQAFYHSLSKSKSSRFWIRTTYNRNNTKYIPIYNVVNQRLQRIFMVNFFQNLN